MTGELDSYRGGQVPRALAALLLAASMLIGVAAYSVVSVPKAGATTTAPYSTWTSAAIDHQLPFPSGSTEALNAVSCASSVCAAVDSIGYVYVTGAPTGAPSTWFPFHIDGNNKLTAVSCPATNFCAAVDNAGNIFISTNPTSSTSWANVSPSAYTTAPAQVFTGVSCSSVSLCAVTSTVAGNTNIFISTLPQTSTGWPLAAGFSEAGVINSISCVATATPTSFCLATDSAGNVIFNTVTGVFTPTAGWTVQAVAGAGNLHSISCTTVTANLCALVDSNGVNGDAFTTAPNFAVSPLVVPAPTESVSLDGGDTFTSVSCAASTLCVAGDNAGRFFYWEGAWGATANNSDGGPPIGVVSGVSCPTTTLCVASDNQGRVLNTTGTAPLPESATWSSGTIDGVESLLSISCPSSSLCVAGDNEGNIITSTNPSASISSDWATPVKIDSNTPDSITAISCPTTTFCVAADNSGYVYVSSSPTGGLSAWPISASIIDSQPGGIVSLSCPTTGLCVGTDGTGGLVYSTTPATASSWSRIAADGSNSIKSISCASAGLCVAVDNVGQIIYSSTPSGGSSTWHVLDVDGANPLVSVSCPTLNLCVLADSVGNIIYSTVPSGGSAFWPPVLSAQKFSVTGAAHFQALSCVSQSLCLAFNTSNNVFTSTDPTNPTGSGVWGAVTTTPSPVDPAGQTINGLACPVGTA
ncbi:MAG TPA: hypothetical protein VMU77_00610, partial [Acidimicrobiales bacterium]|nr:hypothetical protein [Acidimicrobiales bacterium]